MVVVLAGLFGGGMALALLQSVGLLVLAGPGTFTLQHYVALGGDREFHAAVGLSMWVAGAATVISLALGLLLAAALHYARMQHASKHLGSKRQTRAGGWVWVLLQFPLAMPHLSLALVVLHLASPSGLVSRFAYHAGLTGEPADFPLLVQDGYGIGMIAAYVWKEAPFLAVVALTMLARVDREFADTARSLGASPWQVWRHVYAPLIAPGVVSASLAVFAYVFGAYEVPLLLGRTYPAMLGVLAEQRFSSIDLMDRPAALAVALAMSAIAGLLVWASLRLSRQILGERPVLF